MFSSPLLLSAIAIEGYAVLAVELLTIRQLTPYVGNATDTVAIVIAAVLLPLAFGYEAGGRASLVPGDEPGVRRQLTRSLLIAALVLSFGLSHPFLAAFFAILDSLGLTHRLVQTAIHACLFLVYPVYLLGQTIPLIAYCSTGVSLPRSTGLMLFLSTLGSFLGSVVSTLVFMTFFDVHITVALTLGLLVLLATLIGWRMAGHNRLALTASALGLYIMAIDSPAVVKAYGIVSNNLYSEVRIVTNPAEDSRLLVNNNSPSSKFAAHPEHRFAYLKFIEKEILRRLETDRPRRILVIGAGGFTIGLEDRFHAYTYVDIDPALRQVSEEYFLRQPLSPNKTFVPESARAFLRRNTETYDVVVLDAFTNRISLPPDLITREAFAAVRQAVAPDGQVIMNIITSPSFADRFSRASMPRSVACFPSFPVRSCLRPGPAALRLCSISRAVQTASRTTSTRTIETARSWMTSVRDEIGHPFREVQGAVRSPCEELFREAAMKPVRRQYERHQDYGRHCYPTCSYALIVSSLLHATP
ncbi:fused MFS/spermidine synthase [Microvirga sp. VF16]|uniref:fused MFS/spermidine synthase n=1 Tax=Microvirga sp. VF16 TaxID=2807101 RepID=UPI00193CD43B|nr:fused MFS/spermidine synthase [Microvirga sp. VF16]QRM34317.1 fused MFS/spermidine synthase [Microvirga sp. VF16]